MEVTHETLDVLAYLEADSKPASILERHGSDLWLTRDMPIGIDDQDAWSWTNMGEFVRVPLFPYQGLSPDPAKLLAFAWQLGFAARGEIGDAEITRLHLVIGSPLEELFDGQRHVGYKLWLGFAARVVPRG